MTLLALLFSIVLLIPSQSVSISTSSQDIFQSQFTELFTTLKLNTNFEKNLMELKYIGNSALFLSNCFKDVGGIISGFAEILENESNATNDGLARLK